MDNIFIEMQNGVRIPKLIYGTAWKKERTTELVIKAVKKGFRGIDTACQPKHYHEPGVGQALVQLKKEGISREDLYVQTKFTCVNGQDPNNIPYDPHTELPRQVMQSFAVSQKNLQTDYVDCLVLHSPLDTHSQTMQVWQTMEDIYNHSAARQLGISNCYDLKQFQRLYNDAKIKPAVLQNRFYSQTSFDKNLREFCTEHHIVYQSFWTLTANPELLQSAVILDIASGMHKTPAQILFRYLTQVGAAPLTGTTADEHMAEDLAIFEFELAEADLGKISTLLE